MFATAGVLALGFRAWLDDKRLAALATVVRTLRAPRADDDWTWCTSTVARGDRETLPRRYDEGFRAFEVSLATEQDARAVLDLAAQYARAHWLLAPEGDERGALRTIVSEAKGRGLSLLDRMHPVMRKPEDLAYALRLYPFPSVVYAPVAGPPPGLALFVRDAGVGVVVIPRQRFTRELGAALASVSARAYVSGVNDSAEAQAFRDWGAVGVLTDSLPPRVTCTAMQG